MSGEVKRLDYCDQGLADDPDGDFVLYSDYADLMARYEALSRLVSFAQTHAVREQSAMAGHGVGVTEFTLGSDYMGPSPIKALVGKVCAIIPVEELKMVIERSAIE